MAENEAETETQSEDEQPQAEATEAAEGEGAAESEAQAEPEGEASLHEAELPHAVAQSVQGGDGQLEILLDTTLEVVATLGTVPMKVRDLLQLGAGSVIKLDRQKGEPLDLYLRGHKFARAHLVVVDGYLAVRISEIIPAQQRE